jgi:hypothetical protein
MIILDQKLVEAGVKEVKYYYNNCPIIGNIFTACLFLSEDRKLLARGISICSANDSHNKEIGRKISKSRALNAIYKKCDSFKINDQDGFDKRDFTFITNSFKVKNDEHKVELINKIDELHLDYEIKNLGSFKRLDVYVPYIYPIEYTRKNFKFKSQYLPEPTKEEKKMFKL